MGIKEVIESDFGLKIYSIIVLGQGLDSFAYLVNKEYLFKQSKHDEARIALKKEVQVLNYLKGKIALQIPDIVYYSEQYGICGYRVIKGETLTPAIYKNMSDKDFVYLLEDSHEEIGREFGLKVLGYYHHPNKDIPIMKADLNDEYYPVEQILGDKQ